LKEIKVDKALISIFGSIIAQQKIYKLYFLFFFCRLVIFKHRKSNKMDSKELVHPKNKSSVIIYSPFPTLYAFISSAEQKRRVVVEWLKVS